MGLFWFLAMPDKSDSNICYQLKGDSIDRVATTRTSGRSRYSSSYISAMQKINNNSYVKISPL